MLMWVVSTLPVVYEYYGYQLFHLGLNVFVIFSKRLQWV